MRAVPTSEPGTREKPPRRSRDLASRVMPDQVTTQVETESEAVDTAALAVGMTAAGVGAAASADAQEAKQQSEQAEQTADAAGAAAMASAAQVEQLQKRLTVAEARAMSSEERMALLESYAVVSSQPAPEPEPAPAPRAREKDEPPKSIKRQGKEKVPFWKRWDGGE